MNQPNKPGGFGQTTAAFFGLSFAGLITIVGGVVFSIVISLKFGYLFGLFIAVATVIRYLHLRKSWKTRPSFNQFQTDTAATYKVPKDLSSASPATPANNESVDKWLGPILRIDKGAIGSVSSPSGKESVGQVENTLLFTPTQAIALMLAPDDAANVSEGALGSAASAFITYSPQSASDKGVEFRLLHKKHWDELMAPLLQMPLSSMLQAHFNYSIPYNKVQSVEVHTGGLMPGLTFHLMDGSKLRYEVVGHEAKDQIGDIKNYLQLRVTVDN